MSNPGVEADRLEAPDRDGPSVVDPAPRRLIAYALAAGVVLEVGLRGGVANAVVTAGVLLIIGALVSDGRLPRSEPRLVALSATVPAAFLAVRASPWLAATNMAAIVVLVGLAIGHARSGSVLDTTPRLVLARARAAAVRGLTGLGYVRRVVPPVRSSTLDRAVRVLRAAAVAVPILAVVAFLLASGDAVFARLLVPNVHAGPLLGHASLTAVLAAAVLCLGAATSSDARDSTSVGRFGVTEVTTMLTLGATVLGLFVLAQLVALTDAGRRLVESSGLTPSEYARSGFFQLCWATALIVVFLTLVRALAAPEVLHRRAVRLLGGAVPLLATGLVVVSLRRMALYDRAFGLTMLRLWVIGAAVWMGAVLIMVAARNIGFGKARNWVVVGAVGAALVLVVVADLANPEAFVVRHNVARLRAGGELDVPYLVGLSDDAVPAIAQASASVEDPALRQAIGASLRCQDRRRGAANLNLGVARAGEARRARCPS